MTQNPITFYAWPTPNGHKISIMLEECGLPYTIKPVNIMEGDQFDDDYLKLNPNNKMPTITDPNGPDGQPHTVFESGAILIYLAEKTGKFLSADAAQRSREIQWLMWQMAGFGPMLGQAHHFFEYAKEEVPYAKNRYANEANRLYGVLDKQLSDHPYVAGNDISIADFAIYPWSLHPDTEGVDISDYPQIQSWQKLMQQREGVQKGMELLADTKDKSKNMSDEQHKKLFGT